ncbi:MAG: hypothetical protein J0H80_01665 [Rhizobiales bacterium]|nr:hypothetical protein [Hyphomicrobiales bacterium]
MTRKTVAEAGFYNGVFLKPGATFELNEGAAELKLDRLKKDDLLSLAKEKGIDVEPSSTNAEIIAAIEAGA